MTWFPIGPDFVFAPLNPAFRRLSRRNEAGRQGLVSNIAIDPSDANTIYVCERPSSGGTSAFRTRDGGRSWTPIADSLQQVNPGVDPSSIVVSPSNPNVIYMSTLGDQGVYVSNDRGDTWGPRAAVNGAIRKLIVDPRTAVTPATTVLYAATTNGIYRSGDGGASWPLQVLPGDVWTLEAHMPTTGLAHFYASVLGQGVYYATDAATVAGWTHLNALQVAGAGIGLPAAGTFAGALVDFCRRNPTRAYLWLFNADTSTQQTLYTTNSPMTDWDAIAMTGAPSPWYGYYAMSFAVAPNSPGDGNNDALFFGSGGIARSIDSGRTWTNEPEWFHADQHAIAFNPQYPSAGVVPTMYIGCDGGLARSSRAADPAYAIGTAPPHHNEGYAIADTGSWQNLNHGKQSSAVYQHTSPAGAPALSYIGLQDTGVNAGGTELGWRAFTDADGGAIAAATGPDGVRVWGSLGAYGGWASFRITRWIDAGELVTGGGWAMIGASVLAGTSNYVASAAGDCIAGAVVHDTSTTLSAPITAGAAAQQATPVAMTNIAVGTVLTLDEGAATAEDVTVTATTATTFSAVFARDHAVGAPIVAHRRMVLRIDDAGAATQISQDFVTVNVGIVAAHPTDANVLYCATGAQRVYRTTAGVPGPATVWPEVATNWPAASIADIEVGPGGEAFALLFSPVAAGGVTTPLFRLSSGSWEPQTCAGLPATAFNFGKLAADPASADTLYASHGARAYRLTRAAGTWTWTDISQGLPGQWIYDMNVRAIGAAQSQKVLLRAAIPTRGIFEADVSPGAADPAISLYMRDHLLDQGWLTPSPDGVTNPYRPAETLWHYMSADIKIDAREPGPGGTAPFFHQTDPEAGPIPPLSHVLFDQLRDNSQALPQSDLARVHVQVHNRATAPSGDLTVWAIWCNAAAGVPSLAASAVQGNAFPFWNQFQANGTIAPNLPADSPWRSVGTPQTLSGVHAANPAVASWLWTIPTLPTGDPGHCCMVAFVHSAASPISEAGLSVDAIVPPNRQIAQKNLHVVAPLPPPPAPGGAGTGSGTSGSGPGPKPGGSGHPPIEYVEFHNPEDVERIVDLVFDFTGLPPKVKPSLRLTPLRTPGPLEDSLVGVAATRPAVPGEDLESTQPFAGTLIGRVLDWLRLLVCLVINFFRRIFGRPTKPCRRARIEVPPFADVIHEATPGERVAVRDVRMAPFERAAAMLWLDPVEELEPGARYVVDVQQWVEGETMAGGGRYVVTTLDETPKRPKRDPLVPPTHDINTDPEKIQEIEREAEKLRYIPPFAREIVERREEEQNKN